MRIFCVIPAFNEKGNIIELCRRLTTAFRREKVPFQILFVIQGTDGSVELFNHLNHRLGHINYLYFPKALGIGKAYRIGFDHVDNKSSHVLTLDADLNHDPSELDKFLDLARKDDPDIIVGSRFIPGGHFYEKRVWKRFISFIVNFLIIKILHLPLHDATSGYRLIKCAVLQKINKQLKETGYPFYMEFIIRAQENRYSIAEIPITYTSRKWGKSKMGKLRTLLDYLSFLFRFFINF